MSTLNIEISTTALKEVFGQDAHAAFLQFSEKMLTCQEHFSRHLKWFPASFCECSTGDLPDNRLEQTISGWTPGWEDHA